MRKMKESRRNAFETLAFFLVMLSAASAESENLLIPLGFMAAAVFAYSIPTLLEKFYDFLVRREEAKSWR